MVAQSEPCNNGEFFATVNLNHQFGSELVTITVNGTSMGTFDSSTPILIGPLTGDNSTIYNIVATDTGDNNCQAETTVGPINCPLPCSIENVITQIQACDLSLIHI